MSTNTVLASAPLTTQNYVLKATGTTIGNSLIWDNGTNVGIGNQGTTYTLDVSGTLRNTTSAYFATTSGSVGIGTTTLTSGIPLSINVATGNNCNIAFQENSSDKWYLRNITSSNAFSFYSVSGSTEVMRLTSAGNVGIGVTSPASRLEVRVAAESPATGAVALIAGTSNGNNDIFRWYDGTTQLGVFKNSGNVGIGTSSPSGAAGLALAINGGASQTRIALKNNTTGDAAGDGFQILLNTDGEATIEQRENLALTFGTNATERMRITSGGQVLIGSTASLYSNVRLSVKQTSANMAAEIWSNYGSDFGSPALTIIKNDNNTTQVFQRFAIDNGNAANGQINGNGASQAAFGTWSDRRLKDNIVELPFQLQNILSLKPCEFDYKNGSGHQIGFIAQEMKEVYPDAVGEDTDGFLTITGWSKTEARLVKAIQELSQQNQDLKSRLDKAGL